MSKEAQTLIVLTPGFPADEADTTCLPFIQTLIKAMKENNQEVEVIILSFQYPFIKKVYRWHGVEVRSFNGRGRAKLYRAMLWLEVWQTLKRLRKEKQLIGLLSFWCTECALIGSYFGRMYGLRHRIWLCGQDAKKGNKYVKRAKPKAEELVALSDFLKREFFNNYGILPAHVIPVGVDRSEFPALGSGRSIDVLGAGSLIPLKQYDVFTEIVGKLKTHIPAINAMICGKGPEEAKLKALIGKAQLEHNLMLKGEIPHGEVLQLMQSAKVFLHPSNYEGFGAVCIEALYAGAHVVSFVKPMDKEIPHWHHVNSEAEMELKVKELLLDKSVTYERVLSYTGSDLGINMMKLFTD